MTATRVRADDADRQAAVDRLARHLADGRLDLNEYDARITKAYAAVYHDDLDALFVDLVPHGYRDRKDGAGSAFGPTFDAFRNADFRTVDFESLRRSSIGRSLRGRPGGWHPVLIVLAVIAALAIIGALVHLMLPLLVIAAVVYLFTHRRSGRCGQDRRHTDHWAR